MGKRIARAERDVDAAFAAGDQRRIDRALDVLKRVANGQPPRPGELGHAGSKGMVTKNARDLSPEERARYGFR